MKTKVVNLQELHELAYKVIRTETYPLSGKTKDKYLASLNNQDGAIKREFEFFWSKGALAYLCMSQRLQTLIENYDKIKAEMEITLNFIDEPEDEQWNSIIKNILKI